jgi:hypothetical protein
VGGVVERICDAYDRQQIAERKAELARAVAEELALLEARAAVVGLAGAPTDASADAEDDKAAVSRLIDDVLARSRNRVTEPVYAEVVP